LTLSRFETVEFCDATMARVFGIGLAAAVALSRLVASLVFGVHATDPLTFSAVVLILVAVGVLANILPAYRATGTWSLPGWILRVEYGGLIAAWATASALRARVRQREDAHVEESEEVQGEEG